MSNPDDKNIRANGIDPLQRLPSLKPKRDLTLGGMKPNKKIFTPNLNVSRNKSKAQSTTNARDQKKDDKGRKDRKNDKNKNFRNGPNLIKSGGVFSEGLGGGERHSRGSGGYGRDSESASSLQRPTIRVREFSKIAKEREDEQLKAIVGDGYGDEEVSEDFKRSLDLETPIKLPMDDGGWSVIQPKPGVLKQEVVVKVEPLEPNDLNSTVAELADVKPPPGLKQEVFEDTDVVKVLRQESPTLILMQLPDTLPGRGPSADDGPRRKNAEPTTTAGEAPAREQVDERCQLSQLEEGKIGKLQIHRSGRVTLALGDTLLEVCSGTPTSCLQQVVSVGVDEASRSANVVALGTLRHKLCAAPEWQALLQHLPH